MSNESSKGILSGSANLSTIDIPGINSIFSINLTDTIKLDDPSVTFFSIEEGSVLVGDWSGVGEREEEGRKGLILS